MYRYVPSFHCGIGLSQCRLDRRPPVGRDQCPVTLRMPPGGDHVAWSGAKRPRVLAVSTNYSAVLGRHGVCVLCASDRRLRRVSGGGGRPVN